jgi:hypothetical protein
MFPEVSGGEGTGAEGGREEGEMGGGCPASRREDVPGLRGDV